MHWERYRWLVYPWIYNKVNDILRPVGFINIIIPQKQKSAGEMGESQVLRQQRVKVTIPSSEEGKNFRNCLSIMNL